MADPRAQPQTLVRMDWGQRGAEALVAGAALAVIVDVLSFTTTLTVAIDAGAEVYPFPSQNSSAGEFARQHDAALAVGRFEAASTDAAITLSPASIASAAGAARIVLPSPNGSALARLLAGHDAIVIGASLRNRTAVARWIAARLTGAVETDGNDARRAVAVIAAGERWPDGSLRPAVEDLWGAGAVIAALSDFGVDDVSPEARAAAAAFRDVSASLPAELAACASGRELALAGFAADVAVAAQLDTSDCVPILSGERFVNAG